MRLSPAAVKAFTVAEDNLYRRLKDEGNRAAAFRPAPIAHIRPKPQWVMLDQWKSYLDVIVMRDRDHYGLGV